METATLLERVRFGAFEFDTRTRELYKYELKLKLQGQPAEVLAMLLDRPGELVTREEIQKRLWPAETFVDFERGLNSAINRLREALSDSAESPRYIETLPRHGYRFVAPVQRTTPKNLPPRIPAAIRLQWLLAVGCVAVLLIAATSYLLWRQTAKTVQLDRRVMLSVLPFENLSGDPSEELFSDGMTREMINWLGRLDARRLGVIAATSAMKYKNSPKKDQRDWA